MNSMPSGYSAPASAPAQQFSRDPTRIVPPKKKPVTPKMHPALKGAASAWAALHGAKFHANIGRGFKKG